MLLISVIAVLLVVLIVWELNSDALWKEGVASLVRDDVEELSVPLPDGPGPVGRTRSDDA